MVKFLTTAYSPLDKDIVREMWVRGDLKDQLGLSHRSARKNKTAGTSRNLEAAPMFLEPHSRSFSEVSAHQYEPALTSSPGPAALAGRQTYLDTPPLSEAGDVYQPDPDQYVYAKVNPSPSPMPPQFPHDRDMVSPQPSYYSVSELPPPSPLPSPKYRYPDGEITSTPPSRRTSISKSTVTQGTMRSPPNSPPLPPYHRSPNTLQLPGGQGHDLIRRLSAGGTPMSPGAYEMRVRSPPQSPHSPHSPHSLNHGYTRPASEVSSYAATDDFYSAEDGSGYSHAPSQPPHSNYPHGDMLHPPQQQYQQHQPPLMDDDQLTVTGDEYDYDRRASQISWQGGRAL